MTRVIEYGTPILYDKVAQELNVKLFDLGYIDDLYPVAFTGVEEEETFPEIYLNDGNRINLRLLPDSSKSYSFFVVTGEMIEEELTFQIPMALIVWMNMQKIAPGKKYDFTSEVIRDVYNVLDDYGCYDLSVNVNDPFEGFTILDHEKLATTMRPYTAFRISFTKNINICTT